MQNLLSPLQTLNFRVLPLPQNRPIARLSAGRVQLITILNNFVLLDSPWAVMQRPIFHQNVAFRSCRCNQNAFSRTGTIYARFRQQRGITGDCSLRRSLLSVRSGPDTDAELEEEIPVLSTKLLKQLFDGADTNK